MATTRAPRRLSKEARREQLVKLAMPLVAEQGFADFSLEEVAERADVTRNLLYHYFPRGRQDLVVEVVRAAGLELAATLATDESVPLPERITANFARIGDHAFGPSDAWRIHRRARAADQPELTGIVAGYTEQFISNISRNHLGTSDPPPLVRLTLTGYLAYAETIADEARVKNISRDRVREILADTLIAAVKAAREASER